MKKISADEVKTMVEKEGLFLIEDIVILISNGVFSAPLQDCGCLQKPPYTTLYNKAKVEQYIAIIKKYEVKKK
jgi:hypothetical protein